MGDVAGLGSVAKHPTRYVEDVNPNNKTYPRMGDVADPGSVAKPMTRHVVDVNPTCATHLRMGDVKNLGSVAKPVYGIRDESNVSDSNHTHARVATTRHSSIIPQTRLLGGVNFKKSRRRCMDSFTNHSHAEYSNVTCPGYHEVDPSFQVQPRKDDGLEIPQIADVNSDITTTPA